MFDMIVFPILWSLLQTVTHTPITQWNPLTLQGAGLFHIAMGAVLGIAAFGRTQEKLNGANNGGAQVPSGNFTAPSVPASGFGAPTGGFGSPTPAPASSFGGGFGSSSPAPATGGFGTPAVVTGFGGKKAPAPQDDPVL
jgi:hypothetical protein